MDLRKYVTPIPSAQGAQPPRRVLSMVLVVVAALLVGAAVGRALPPTAATVATAQPATPAPQAAEPFVYFPAQYENQAKEVEEYIQGF